MYAVCGRQKDGRMSVSHEDVPNGCKNSCFKHTFTSFLINLRRKYFKEFLIFIFDLRMSNINEDRKEIILCASSYRWSSIAVKMLNGCHSVQWDLRDFSTPLQDKSPSLWIMSLRDAQHEALTNYHFFIKWCDACMTYCSDFWKHNVNGERKICLGNCYCSYINRTYSQICKWRG